MFYFFFPFLLGQALSLVLAALAKTPTFHVGVSGFDPWPQLNADMIKFRLSSGFSPLGHCRHWRSQTAEGAICRSNFKRKKLLSNLTPHFNNLKEMKGSKKSLTHTTKYCRTGTTHQTSNQMLAEKTVPIIKLLADQWEKTQDHAAVL